MAHLRLAIIAIAFTLVAAACSDDGGTTLTVYSGRNEELVGPLLQQFEEETGIDVEVRYASSTDLAATLREEGRNSPADVFFAQDPASLGVVAEAGLFTTLPDDVLSLVPIQFSDEEGRWIGTSGRARVLVYDSGRIGSDELPATVDGFLDPEWDGRVAIAPTNGSFLAFVSAMILMRGEDATRTWLEGIADNDPGTYPKNSVIVTAVDEGEIEVGLVNHYYLLRRQDELGATVAANHFLTAGGPGSLVMPAGIGVLATSNKASEAMELVEFLLSQSAQEFFVEETFEYPVIEGIAPNPTLPPLDTLTPPDIDLSDLASVLDTATDLVAEAGLL